MMYVVDIWEDGGRLTPKVFSALPPANTYAAAEIEDGRDAKVYEVPVDDDPYAAVAAMKIGDGRLVAAPQHKATTEEILAADRERAATPPSLSTTKTLAELGL